MFSFLSFRFHCEDTYVNIDTIMLLNNNADSRGGGVFIDKRGVLEGYQIQLIENYAQGEGGGMYMGWGGKFWH